MSLDENRGKPVPEAVVALFGTVAYTSGYNFSLSMH